MEQSVPVETQPVSYAGFWKRFLAYIIDAVLLSVVSMILFVPLLGLIGMGTLGSMFQEDSGAPVGLVMALVGTYLVTIVAILVAGWLYYALMESSGKGATLGKMALGIRVTDMTGNRISFGKATGRYFGKILSGLILYVGFIMAGFTQQKQALHDILSGCLVVNK